MLISQLPLEIRQKALENQEDENSQLYSSRTDNLFKAFCWEDTKEGYEYWYYWCFEDYKTYKKVINDK